MDTNKIEFDVFSKVEVNGPNASDLWKYLNETRKGTFEEKGYVS